MKEVLKSILLAPSQKKLSEYDSKFARLFAERDVNFDHALGMIRDFHRDHELFPDPMGLVLQLQNEGASALSAYIEGVIRDETIPVYTSDEHFIHALNISERDTLNKDAHGVFLAAQQALASAPPGAEGIASVIEDVLGNVHRLKAKSTRNDASISSLLYGAQRTNGHSLEEIYARIKEKKESNDAVYYDLGLSHFATHKMKDGDLVIIGAFTSHGKSIILRQQAYRQLVEYGRNVAFFSFEMSHDAVLVLFNMLHANNKDIFPNTPYITYDAWKEGELTEEEEDFLFNRAAWDLRNNPAYGTLYLDQPNKAKYRVTDLAAKLQDLETLMPVHTVVLDYITLMYPRESDRGEPDRTDFNMMVKSCKNLALTHRSSKGDVSPFLFITAAQLSRKGLENALKNESQYDISAFAEYSELEKSADHLFTCLLTPELKATKRMRIQGHKNRDGAVALDYLDVFVDLERGFGITEVAEATQAEVVESLKSLDI